MIEYSDLNPDSTGAYDLEVIGTLPDGSTKELVRSVHLGEIICSYFFSLGDYTFIIVSIHRYNFRLLGSFYQQWYYSKWKYSYL